MTRSLNRASVTPWTLALAAALAGAGLIHCLLTPEHLAMSAIFGAGFLAAGVGQLAMAGFALVRPSRLLYAAVIASTVGLSSMYAYNVLVGLPFHDDAASASAGDADQADEHSDEAAHSAAAAHSDEAGHSGVDEHSDDVHPSGEASTSAEAGHAEADDHEEPAEAGHHEDGLVLGGGEPVDAYGALTQFAQFSAAVIAAVLLVRSRHPIA